MRKTLFALAAGLLCTVALAEDKVPRYAYLQFDTTEGTFVMELNGEQAPITVKHFLALADSGFFDGTIFHRVRPGHVVQGGGFTPGLKLKEDDNTIVNESGNGLTNARGTVAMARVGDPHSANSQFFVNLVDNTYLDGEKKLFKGTWGYAVFGQVIEGMDVIDKIAEIPTTTVGNMQDVPVRPIIVNKVSRYTFE